MSATFKSEQDDWNAYMQEEHSFEEYKEKFGLKMDKEQLGDNVKTTMMKIYLQDLATQIHHKVI